MMCAIRTIPVFLKKVRSSFGRIFFPVRFSQVGLSGSQRERIRRSFFVSGHSVRRCFADVGIPHVQGGASWKGLLSISVDSQRSRWMELAVRRGICATGAYGLDCGAALLRTRWFSIFAHVTVAWVQMHRVFLSPSFASVSAFSLPGMF